MEKRIGRQEPTLAHVIPYQITEGEIAVRLYEATGRTIMDWQKGLLFDILAMNEERLWVHTRYGFEVSRRNGKGEVLIARELYALAMGERVLHTAHLTSTAHSAWERLCSILTMLGLEYESIKAKGQEFIGLPGGGRIDFRTRTSTGALGEGFDLMVIDEAQEYKTEHQTALKYVVTASHNPQTILCGTPPTAVSAGTVFKDYREGVLAGELQNAGWAEWSVTEISDVNDRELWYFCNPSLGITLKERDVADEVGRSEAERIDFNIQRLGLWLKYSQQSAISLAAWEACLIKKQPELSGRLCVGIKYNRDGSTVSLSIAGRLPDDRIFIEVAGRRQVREGNSWIIDFLSRLGKNAARVVIDGAGGSEILQKDMKAAKLKPPIMPKVKEVIEAFNGFEVAVYQKTLCHKGQPSLTGVVTNSEHRAIGTGGGFGYMPINEMMDISLLESVALAHWAAANYKPKKQKISY
ncbi:MAG: terminase [Lachnospiraceae bacterium]|nr:terminase [Lachnospiraceae bacterium]